MAQAYQLIAEQCQCPETPEHFTEVLLQDRQVSVSNIQKKVSLSARDVLAGQVCRIPVLRSVPGTQRDAEASRSAGIPSFSCPACRSLHYDACLLSSTREGLGLD